MLSHGLSLVKEDQRRDADDSILGSQVRFFVHIQLSDLELAVVDFGKLFQCGGQHPAGHAPFSPKIHQYG